MSASSSSASNSAAPAVFEKKDWCGCIICNGSAVDDKDVDEGRRCACGCDNRIDFEHGHGSECVVCGETFCGSCSKPMADGRFLCDLCKCHLDDKQPSDNACKKCEKEYRDEIPPELVTQCHCFNARRSKLPCFACIHCLVKCGLDGCKNKAGKFHLETCSKCHCDVCGDCVFSKDENNHTVVCVACGRRGKKRASDPAELSDPAFDNMTIAQLREMYLRMKTDVKQ